MTRIHEDAGSSGAQFIHSTCLYKQTTKGSSLPVTTSLLPLRDCCARTTCHLSLSPFNHPPLPTVFPVFLWEASLPVHSLKSNEGIWPFPGDRHVTDTQLITLPFLGSYILYTWCANMGTVGVLSARAMPTLHGLAHAHVPTAMVLPTFPLPWFSPVSYWFWLPGLQSSLLAVL